MINILILFISIHFIVSTLLFTVAIAWIKWVVFRFEFDFNEEDNNYII
jgi:hypothetical protein